MRMTRSRSRRSFLLAAASLPIVNGRLSFAQEKSPSSPEEALQRLMEGNRRFASNQYTSIAKDLKVLKEHTVEKQEPFAAVLSCAGSRVPVKLIFPQTICHIFVSRVAGNILNSEIIGSLVG
jgi:carbonic anhydrase